MPRNLLLILTLISDRRFISVIYMCLYMVNCVAEQYFGQFMLFGWIKGRCVVFSLDKVANNFLKMISMVHCKMHQDGCNATGMTTNNIVDKTSGTRQRTIGEELNKYFSETFRFLTQVILRNTCGRYWKPAPQPIQYRHNDPINKLQFFSRG